MNFLAPLVLHRDQISNSQQARLFGRETMRDQVSFVLCFLVIGTFVSLDVVGRNVAEQVKMVQGHAAATTLCRRLFLAV